MKKNYKSKFGLLFLGLLAVTGLTAQQTYTFTNAGNTGRLGPSQTQVNTAYSGSNLSGSVTVSNGIQQFVVPPGVYRINAYGAQGGDNTTNSYAGGFGARVQGDFTLTSTTTLNIIVGQEGEDYQYNTGGGGGTFVWITGQPTPLVAAGGGGGAGYGATGVNGTVSTSGTQGTGSSGTAGTGGNGANPGGGGWLSPGVNFQGASCTAKCSGNTAGLTVGGASPTTTILYHGCAGTSSTGDGGFGGASGGNGNCTTSFGSGGGGGYSGGVGQSGSSAGGGGGGSYNGGSNQTNSSGVNSGHGKVIITELCSVKILSSASGTVNPAMLCSGNSLTLTTDAVSNFSWSTGQTTSSIVVAPTTNTFYTVSGTSSMACNATGVMSVIVSSGPPVLSITQSTPSTCFGNTVTLSASGALSYTWSHGLPNGAVLTPPPGNNTYTVYGQNGCGTTNATAIVSVSALPVNATASPSIICEGKTTTLSATGATTFTWMPTNQTGSVVVSSASAPTIFTVTGTSGSCSGTYTFMLQTKPNPTVSLVGTAMSVCEGGTVGLTASGGDNYTWTPSHLSGSSAIDTPTAPTLYQVVGDNSVGCTSSAQHVVVTLSPPQANGNLTNTLICLGKTVTLSVSGSATTYSWNTGGTASSETVAPATSTVFNVLIGHNSNTCTATLSFSVDVVKAHLAVSQSTAICLGSAVTLTSAAGTGHVWSPGGFGQNLVNASPAVTTTYTVSANVQTMNIICAASNTVVVTVNPNPTVTATASRTNICRNEVITLNGFGAASFQWSNQQSGATATFSSSTAGQPKVTVTGTDVNGCTDGAEIQLIVSACNRIGEHSSGGFMVYPNPSSGAFIVKGDAAAEVTLFNSLGQQLLSGVLDSDNKFELNVKGLDAGVYFVKVSGSSVNHSRTVVVTR
jgi:hypothetical protein